MPRSLRRAVRRPGNFRRHHGSKARCVSTTQAAGTDQNCGSDSRTATGRKASRHRSRAHRETPLGPAPGRGPLRDSPLATPTHRLTNPDKDKKRMDLRFAAKEPGEAQSRGVPRRCGAAPFPPGTVYPSRARRGRRGGSRAGPAGPARPAGPDQGGGGGGGGGGEGERGAARPKPHPATPDPGAPRSRLPSASLTGAAGGRTAQGRAEDEAGQQQPQQPQVPRGGRGHRCRHPSAPRPGQHGTARPGAGRGVGAPGEARRGGGGGRRRTPRKTGGGGGTDAAAEDPGGGGEGAESECACAPHLRRRDRRQAAPPAPIPSPSWAPQPALRAPQPLRLLQPGPSPGGALVRAGSPGMRFPSRSFSG